MANPFSRVYCIPDEKQHDSERLRRRLGRYASDMDRHAHLIADRIEKETGARVPRPGGYLDIDSFFQGAELRDVLDSITHIHNALIDRARVQSRNWTESETLRRAASEWRAFAGRVLKEEHSPYEIGEDCNVQYAVDEAYSMNRRATLNGLQAPRWDAVRAEFERAFRSLDGVTQDTNAAIRAMSAAVEACVKVLLANGVSRVGLPEIEKNLWPAVQAIYADDKIAADASHQILKSLGDWVNAAHQYRHGQGVDNEVAGPLELAVQMLTSGASFIRWLIDMDARKDQQA